MTEAKLNLENYIQKAISYEQYLNDIESVIENKTKEENYLEYYALNQKRIQRLDKTIQLSEIQADRLEKLDRKLNLLIITEGWCADAAQIIPVVNKLAEYSDLIETKLVYRDENEDLMNQYLFNGSKSIPIVIGVDATTYEEKFVWGPRPEFGNELLKQYKAGDFSVEEFKLNLQKAYNKDKGNMIIEEFLAKLEL